MQAIITRFIPWTNYRQSRVKAVCEAGSLTLGWDHALNDGEPMSDHLTCTDPEGNKYRLVYMPYIPGENNHACMECAFLIRGVCRAPKTCTPTDGNGNRLVSAGWAWERADDEE